jgi:imidazolonepropionase-like amidohydrolase
MTINLPGRGVRHIVLFAFACLCVAGFASNALAHPFVPGKSPATPIALRNVTIHPVDGPAIAPGDLVFDQGKIVALGAGIEIPANAESIDLTGKHVYPGLFDASTSLGLIEIDSVRATIDERETGDLNPNAQAWVAINPDSELIPVARANGILLALVSPAGGLFSGQSAVVQLDGWTIEEMLLTPALPAAAIHVDWPRMAPAAAGDTTAARDSALSRLEDVMRSAAAYRTAREANPARPVDARWEAMLPLLAGERRLIVGADEASQIEAAVAFAQRHKLKLAIYGGYEAELCAPLLKAMQTPVIVAGTHRLPRRAAEAYDAPFTLPERLRAAGVKYCIAGAGKFGASNVRNLPYHAATAAAYGLPPEEALRAITLYPAEILGVADRVGSLTAGKDATLIVTDGDPLETPTQVERAFIQGRPVDLNDRHKTLWRKYLQKYGFTE